MKQFLSILACGAMFATFATTSHAQVNIDQIKMSTGNGNALTMLTSGLAAAHTITIPDPGGNVTMILSGTLAGTQTINGTVDFPGTVNFTAAPTLPLASGNIYVGNGGSPSVATGVAMTGDISISNAGLTAITSSATTSNDITTTLNAHAPTSAIDVAAGGTNSSTALTGNAVMVSDGTHIVQGAINASATNEFLTQANGNAPAWNTIQSGDVPWATPGTIGSTTPNTGAFTQLSAAAGSINGASLTVSTSTFGGFQGGVFVVQGGATAGSKLFTVADHSTAQPYAQVSIGDQNNQGQIGLHHSASSGVVTQITSSETATRNIAFPDNSGIVALTSDISNAVTSGTATQLAIYTGANSVGSDANLTDASGELSYNGGTSAATASSITSGYTAAGANATTLLITNTNANAGHTNQGIAFNVGGGSSSYDINGSGSNWHVTSSGQATFTGGTINGSGSAFQVISDGSSGNNGGFNQIEVKGSASPTKVLDIGYNVGTIGNYSNGVATINARYAGSTAVPLFVNPTGGSVGVDYNVSTFPAATSLPYNLSVNGTMGSTGAATFASETLGSPLPVGSGGTGSDLSATGGASEVLMQGSVGGAVTVAQLANTDISGLGTMSTQNANAVAITSGTITGTTLDNTNSIAGDAINSGLVGVMYGGTGSDLSATGGASEVLMQTSNGGAVTVAQLANTDISGLGTMSTQDASAVSITGGTIDQTTIGSSTASTGDFTHIGNNAPGTGIFTTLELTSTSSDQITFDDDIGHYNLSATNWSISNAGGGFFGNGITFSSSIPAVGDQIQFDNTNQGTLASASLSGAQTWTLPDATGNVSLTTSAGTALFTGPTVSRTYTLPDANATLATTANTMAYDVTAAQNTAAAGTDNLFSVAYPGAESGATVAGASINATTTGTTSATGLTVTAQAGSGAAVTGLSVAASGGATNMAVNATAGNINVATGGAYQIGGTTMLINTGAANSILVGAGAGSNAGVSTDGEETLIGAGANVPALGIGSTSANATAIGYGAVVSTVNTIQLGNTGVTKVNTAGALASGLVGINTGSLQLTNFNGKTGTIEDALLIGQNTAFTIPDPGVPAASFVVSNSVTTGGAGSGQNITTKATDNTPALDVNSTESTGSANTALYLNATGGSTTNTALDVKAGGITTEQIASKSATYTATTSDYIVLESANGTTVNLPASPITGEVMIVKFTNTTAANTMTLSGNGNSIDGSGSWTLYSIGTSPALSGATLVYDGSQWDITATSNN